MMFNRFLGRSALKPRIAKSRRIDLLRLKGNLQTGSALRSGSKDTYYIVASVEVGNTTTKCILTATNLREGKAYIINKKVKMTRDVRPPKHGEEVFGRTLDGVPLTRESVSELVRDTLLEAHKESDLNIKRDLNFAVRSTGVVAGFDSPDDVGTFVLSLADGCLSAGVPTRNMTPAISIDGLPKNIRKFSLLEKVYFDGGVGGVTPPFGSTGVEIVANEMEGELATVGIKEGAKWAGVDFRNPCVSMDFGTTLDGRITDDGIPYARTIGNFCGLAGAIPDNIVKGALEEDNITALDLFEGKNQGSSKRKKSKFFSSRTRREASIENYTDKIHHLIRIEKVPLDRKKYGYIPVNPKVAEDIGVTLIGCDVGENGDRLNELREMGREIMEKDGLEMLSSTIDVVCAVMVERLLKVSLKEGLISDKTAIGLTGRAAITGNKPSLTLELIEGLNLYSSPEENVVFVDDGLARGAAAMARCMNSLGNPKNPIGGVRGKKCVLSERIKRQQRKMEG